MKIAIDEAGRLVIPREVRRAAGIEPGMALQVRVDDGAVIIEPAPTPVKITRRGGFFVAEPARTGPALTGHTVQATRERLQAEQGVSRGSRKG